MPRLTRWSERTAVVTGASSGIGRLLAVRMAVEGARAVALVARRESLLHEVAEEIERAGAEAHVVPCDVGDRRAAEDAARVAADRLGRVDVLVNGAGYGRHRLFADWDVDDMERMMRVNHFGAVHFTKALVPGMIDRGEGWVVFIASVAGKIGVPDESAYVASKFAMVGLAEALSIELEDAGVHVVTVCPGATRTDFFDDEALERMPPVARRSMIDPGHVVDATIRALAAGKHEITLPRSIRAAYVLRSLVPRLFRRGVKRATLDAARRAQGAAVRADSRSPAEITASTSDSRRCRSPDRK